jgi:hypothetical protein
MSIINPLNSRFEIDESGKIKKSNPVHTYPNKRYVADSECVLVQIEPKPLNHFKFRTECFPDVMTFRNLFKEKTGMNFVLNVVSRENSDATLELFTTASLKEVRDCMFNTKKGHAMWQSVNYADKYTGERYIWALI